jgi:thiol-disulfide isomerase/thioredoxin
MGKTREIIGLMILVIFVLAACNSSQPVNQMMSNEGNLSNSKANDMSDEMPDEMDEMTESSNSSDEMMEAESTPMTNTTHDMMEEGSETELAVTPVTTSEEPAVDPTWVDYEFTDAATGETFSISSYKGKVVLVETMAMWCSNCLKQQTQVKELHALLGDREDFIGIGIDVDLNEDIVRLAGYVEKYGFDWRYSVAPQEVLAGIQSDLGGQFLNPPSTPIVLFDKEGQPHPLPFGIKSANELLSFVEQYLN